MRKQKKCRKFIVQDINHHKNVFHTQNCHEKCLPCVFFLPSTNAETRNCSHFEEKNWKQSNFREKNVFQRRILEKFLKKMPSMNKHILKIVKTEKKCLLHYFFLLFLGLPITSKSSPIPSQSQTSIIISDEPGNYNFV